MLSPGVWYWPALVVVSLCPQGSYTVTVKVQSTVVTDQSRGQVILPCEYELDNPNQAYNIRWDKDRDVVIVKDSLDQLFYGDKYTGRVKWGEGCSLVLLSPGLNDTGRYRFNLAALEDQNPWETAYVQLTVKEAGIGETTPGKSSTPQSADPTSAGTLDEEDGGTSPVHGHVVYAAFLTVFNITALVFQILLTWKTRQTGRTDTLTRLCLGSPVVLFGIGAVTSVVSMVTRNRMATIVSFVALTVGNGIDWVFLIIKWKMFHQCKGSRRGKGENVSPMEDVCLALHEWEEVRLSHRDVRTLTNEYPVYLQPKRRSRVHTIPRLCRNLSCEF